MPRTTGRLRTDTTARLAKLRQQRPEWEAWIRLLAMAEQASHDESWHNGLSESELATNPSTVLEDAPLLHGRRLPVDSSWLQRLVRNLASATSSEGFEGGASLHRYRPSTAEALDLVSAATREDDEGIQALAESCGLEAGALATVAHLAAYPLLQSCGQQLESGVPPSWQHGYCPVCAAWPTLAERRGLDRSRRLRCGRCAVQWEVAWLYCIYCGERNHERLGSLQPDDQGELLKVETCSTCQGYLKSIATLQGFSAFELLLQDLETVELDLIALDQGYGRPRGSGFVLDFHIVDRASRRTL